MIDTFEHVLLFAICILIMRLRMNHILVYLLNRISHLYALVHFVYVNALHKLVEALAHHSTLVIQGYRSLALNQYITFG